MTTYTFTAIESGWYTYDDLYDPEFSGSGKYQQQREVAIRLPDAGAEATVTDGQLAVPGIDWTDHFLFYAGTWQEPDVTYRMLEITWAGGTTTAARMFSRYNGFDGFGYASGMDEVWLLLDGPALPEFDDRDSFTAFIGASQITYATGPYAEGSTIALADIPGVSLSENDTFHSSEGLSESFGGIGNDLFIETGDSTGPDLFDGGAGQDVIRYAYTAFSDFDHVVLDLAVSARNGGAAEGDVLVSVENVIGGTGDDRIFGDATANRLRGQQGDDLLVGRGGDDRLHGMEGNDRLIGGAGADRLDGGAGHDTASYVTSDRRIAIDLQIAARNSGDALGDSWVSIEAVEASRYNDILRGDGGNNRLIGGAGNDVIRGRAGNDVLIGQTGDDVLIGDAGNDHLRGGAGADEFRYVAGHDVIEDFTAGTDLLLIAARWDPSDLSAAASVTDAGLLLDFAPAHSLLLEGITALDAVLADISGF